MKVRDLRWIARIALFMGTAGILFYGASRLIDFTVGVWIGASVSLASLLVLFALLLGLSFGKIPVRWRSKT